MAKPNKLSKGTPRQSATLFRNQRRPHLICQQDEFLDYDGHKYTSIEEATIHAEVSEWLAKAEVGVVVGGQRGTLAFHPKRNDINEVTGALRDLCHVPANTMAPPCWLDQDPSLPDPRDIISHQGGLLDIKTRKRYPATPNFFTRSALDITYDPDTKCLLFEKFVDEVMDHRPELARLLKQSLGYLLSTVTNFQKVFFMPGPPGSGKGTLFRILDHIGGKENVAHPTVEQVASRFGYAALLGKSIAIVADMHTGDRGKLTTAANRINTISGEDGVQFERKYLDPWEGRLGVRFIMAANELPDFGTHAGALRRRLIVIPFDVSFEGSEDFDLTERLKVEAAGILNWALDGLDDLHATGHFVEPPESLATKKRLLGLANPVIGFLEEYCTVDPHGWTTKQETYDLYCAFCNSHGIKSPLTLDRFAEKIYEITKRVVRPGRAARDDESRRETVFRGLRPNDDQLRQRFEVDEDLLALGLGLDAILRDINGNWVERPIEPFGKQERRSPRDEADEGTVDYLEEAKRRWPNAPKNAWGVLGICGCGVYDRRKYRDGEEATRACGRWAVVYPNGSVELYGASEYEDAAREAARIGTAVVDLNRP